MSADVQTYPEAAAQAVRNVHAQHPSPYYGYIRSGLNQKIYLFPQLEDARNWFGQHVQLQPDHEYAAVFAASNLQAPITGMEHFRRTAVGCVPIGNWWPFLAGLPLGALGGYFFHDPISKGVERLKTKMAGDPYVGGPWMDLAGQDDGGFSGGYSDGYSDGYRVGGPDYGGYADGYRDYSIGCPIGAEGDDAARRSTWPQTKALIQSAIDDVMREAANYPTEAYVWKLEAPSAPYAGSAPGSVIMAEGTTIVVPFSSQGEALNYLREVAQTRPVALALFERSSPHWPNPVAWRKSSEPDHASVIAQYVASRSATHASGVHMGADVYMGADTVMGAALAEVRRRAQQLADKRAGNVIGVIHTLKDGLWHTLAFRSSNDADDWLGTATSDPASYTYAAYYDKDDFQWPHPVNEKIGGARAPHRPGTVTRDRPATTSGAW